MISLFFPLRYVMMYKTLCMLLTFRKLLLVAVSLLKIFEQNFDIFSDIITYVYNKSTSHSFPFLLPTEQSVSLASNVVDILKKHNLTNLANVQVPKFINKVQKFLTTDFMHRISMQYCKKNTIIVQISTPLLYILQTTGRLLLK